MSEQKDPGWLTASIGTKDMKEGEKVYQSLQKLPATASYLDKGILPDTTEAWLRAFVENRSNGTQQFAKHCQDDKTLAARLSLAAVFYLAGEDRDAFFRNFEHLLPEESKNQLWENNHILILHSINKLTCTLKRFPGRSEISSDTGLSRQTINKHLKNYFKSNQYKQKREEFTVMREKLLARLYCHAMDGDLKAARVFFEATSGPLSSLKVENQQNNFINLNGITVTLDQLENLPLELQGMVVEVLSLAIQNKELC